MYLKRWANAERRVWAYRTLVSRDTVPLWKLQSLRSVAYHEHLYAQLTQGDAFEKWLAEHVDGPSDSILERVAQEDRLSSDDWDVLLRFFATAQVRTPAHLLVRRQQWETTMPDLLKTPLQNAKEVLERGGPIPASQHKDPYLPTVDLPARVRVRKNPAGKGGIVEANVVCGRQLWLREIERIAAHTFKRLRVLNWTLLRPPPGQHWLTSDDPVTIAHVSLEGVVTFRGGWKVPGTALLLPLDPLHVMYARMGGRLPVKYSAMSVDEADFVHQCTVRTAHRMVFAVAPDDRVAEIGPRRVDEAAFEHDRRVWVTWDEEQSQAERDLQDEATWPTGGPPDEPPSGRPMK
jgi:hypothetical protein